MSVQLEFQMSFLEDNSDIGILRQEVASYRESQERVRKSLFAKQADVWKEIMKIKMDLDRLESLNLNLKRIK